MPPRSGRLRGSAFPVLLSLVLHVPLLLLFWFFPRTEKGPAGGRPAAGPTLCLDDARQPGQLHRPPRPATEETLDLQNVVLDETPVASPVTIAPTKPPSVPVAATSVPGNGPPSAPPASTGQGGQGMRTGPGGAGGGLFAMPVTARRVVYVIDCSASMGVSGALVAACRQLLVSLSHLPAGARFQVIPYNSSAQPLCIKGSIDLLVADVPTLTAVAAALDRLEATGVTEHRLALRRGLDFQPDVLYLVTDADDVPMDVLNETRFSQARTTIHTIELRRRVRPPADSPLRRLAESSGGTYRCLTP